MNQKPAASSFQRLFLIILLVNLLISILNIQGIAIARAQTASQAVLGSDNAKDALTNALQVYMQQNVSKLHYRIFTIYATNSFAYAAGEPFDPDTGQRIPEETFVPLLAKLDSSGTWQSVAPGIVPDDKYNGFLISFPDTVIDASTKAFLHIPKQPELIVQNFVGYKLPWPNQQNGWVTKK